MNRRMKLALVSLVLAVAYVVGQQPLEQPITPPDTGIQPVQHLEFPVMTRPRGQLNGQLMSQQNPIPVVNSAENFSIIGMPPQPPTPAVSVAVLVPSDHPPGEDVPCTIRVSNTSGGDAHKVEVRAEIIGGQAVPQNPPGAPNALSWKFGTMKTGASEKIEMKIKPAVGSPSVSVKAFVSCEHGQIVKTNLSERKLKVKTELPKVAVAEEPIPVRVTIRNDGRVPITGAKLTQTISDGFEFHKDIATGERGKDALQRNWKIGTIAPGEQKVLQYLLTATKGRSLGITSSVDADNKLQANDTASVSVGESQLRVNLTGNSKTDANQTAYYEAEVTNTGTTTLKNIRVTGTVPDDCRLMRVTFGGKDYRDMVTWTIDKLAPGERQTVRWGLQSTSGNRRQIRAIAEAGRGVEHSSMIETLFPGEANLHMQSEFDNPKVDLNRTGLLTVTVKNNGTAAATNVRVSVVLPKDVVGFQQASPTSKQVGDTIEFEPRTVAAGKVEKYTITFKGQQIGGAWFRMKMSADGLDRPIDSTQKYVEIR